MSNIKQKNTAKSSAAIAAGVVGAGAAYAALRGESPAETEQQAPVATGTEPVQQPVAAVAAEPAQMDELVQSYLGEGQAGVPSADALTAADISDMLPEPEMLDALVSYPGVDVAQAGAGAGAGAISSGTGGGIGGFFTGIGEGLGFTGGAATGVGVGAFGLGLGAAGYGIDQVVNGC